jgi:D-3-phosphoglycerate dehydrogenase
MRDRPRVVVLSPVDAAARERLAEDIEVAYAPDARDEQALADPRLAGADVLVVRSNVTVDERLLERHPALRAVVRAGSGTDNVDREALDRRGVALVRAGAGAGARAVAELALALLIAVLRGLPRAVRGVDRGEWLKRATLGEEVAGLPIGVWGYGEVGRASAALLTAAGAEVAVLAHPSARAPRTLARDELLAWARAHVLALPLRDATRGIVDGETLAAMAPRAPWVVNVGRWELVDFPAALRALREGTLSGLAIDPAERRHLDLLPSAGEPLNLLVTPHVGAMTARAQAAIGEDVVACVRQQVQPAAVSG